MSDVGADSDTAYFFPSQTQNTKERRKRGRKAKKQGQAKRQIQSKSYDAINDEENQGGDEGTEKSERDSKYIVIFIFFCSHEILMRYSTVYLYIMKFETLSWRLKFILVGVFCRSSLCCFDL